jgi:hypothetical protein
MAIIIDLNKVKVESKWHAFKENAKRKAQQGIQWIRENPESAGLLATACTALIGGGLKISKSLVRTHNLKKEQYNKERYIYDRSLGMYLHTKRPLRNKDYVTINRRRQNGEKLSDILESMKILE